jgi:argininosuccinate lyase
MRLWDKGTEVDGLILDFTVGDDHILDLRLVEYDCLASMAHARMLHKIEVLTRDDMEQLVEGLAAIKDLAQKGEFEVRKEQEDCHTAIEAYLTEKYGEAGRKIHLGRSRNDQVLTALRLYEKAALDGVREGLLRVREALMGAADRYGRIPIPGYTHMRRAMPASVGMWLGSYAAAVDDDSTVLETVFGLVDRSPLGTAAGFGVPVFELDREMTAERMGFSGLISNPMYAQLSRGKIETHVLSLLSGIMFSLQRLAADILLFSMEEFGYIILPDRFCTGSSIMPQKKNPDVLELVRGKYHEVCGEESKLRSLVSNLMSGYQRDLQLMKGPLFRAFDTTTACLEIMTLVLSGIEVDESRCRSAMTDDLFATEKAYRLVRDGMPFRDAYKISAPTTKNNRK